MEILSGDISMFGNISENKSFLLVYECFIIKLDIKNKKGKQAWNLYQKERNSRDALTLLKLIANECYRVRYALVILRSD